MGSSIGIGSIVLMMPKRLSRIRMRVLSEKAAQTPSDGEITQFVQSLSRIEGIWGNKYYENYESMAKLFFRSREVYPVVGRTPHCKLAVPDWYFDMDAYAAGTWPGLGEATVYIRVKT